MMAKPPLLYIAEAPSNIALVKYWGKRDAVQQWPANDSLSMTLAAARTRTTAHLAPPGQSSDQLSIDGRAKNLGDRGAGKAFAHLSYLRSQLGHTAPLVITSHNTCPSDCGIASSASGLAALTLAAIAAWTDSKSLAALDAAGFSRERLAALARRGSGSACRSLYGGFVRWNAGSSPETQSCTTLAGDDQSSSPWDLADVIVIVSDVAKAVGSTEAHAAAWTSPLFGPRLAGLPERQRLMEAAILHRDLPTLGRELELEALEMHAVAMSATPAVCYMTPATSILLAWTRMRRSEGVLPAWFTLDAGPNPHLICARTDAKRVADAVACDFNYRTLVDGVGTGPRLFVEPSTLCTPKNDSASAAPVEDSQW